MIRLQMGVVLLLLLTSCGKHETQKAQDPHGHGGHSHGHDESEIVNFEMGKGVLFSEETIASLGLRFTEITEQSLHKIITGKAQVYRSSSEPSSREGIYRHGYAYASMSLSSNTAAAIDSKAQIEIVLPDNQPSNMARLVRMDHSLKTTTGSSEVLLEISDPSNSLEIGAFLDVKLSLGKTTSLLVIPSTALLKTVEGSFVYVKNGKHLLRNPVVTGSMDLEWVEIKDGLLAGDVVAANQVETLWLTELRATKGGGHCH